MQPKTIYVTSLEDILVPVRAKKNGVLYDPTGDKVEGAFKLVTLVEPAPGDWVTVHWETDLSGSEPEYYAVCLVGPGGQFVLPAGTYQPFVRITDSPEIPILRSPRLLIVK